MPGRGRPAAIGVALIYVLALALLLLLVAFLTNPNAVAGRGGRALRATTSRSD